MTALIFKEWIKTRWCLLLIAAACWGTTIYNMIRVFRAVNLRGVEHIWQVVIGKDAIFVDSLTYIPAIGGLLLSLVQFMPEMKRKSLKLTLHLPLPRLATVNTMLIYGAACLAVIFVMDFIIIICAMKNAFASQIVARISLAIAPWHIAGLCSYLLTSCIVLEPTWKRRIAISVAALLLLSIFYLGQDPAAYTVFWPGLLVVTLLSISLSWLSVDRFVAGKQD